MRKILLPPRGERDALFVDKVGYSLGLSIVGDAKLPANNCILGAVVQVALWAS